MRSTSGIDFIEAEGVAGFGIGGQGARAQADGADADGPPFLKVGDGHGRRRSLRRSTWWANAASRDRSVGGRGKCGRSSKQTCATRDRRDAPPRRRLRRRNCALAGSGPPELNNSQCATCQSRGDSQGRQHKIAEPAAPAAGPGNHQQRGRQDRRSNDADLPLKIEGEDLRGNDGDEQTAQRASGGNQQVELGEMARIGLSAGPLRRDTPCTRRTEPGNSA